MRSHINLLLHAYEGRFTLKGFTFSGELPPEHLTKDGVSVILAGLKYFSKYRLDDGVFE